MIAASLFVVVVLYKMCCCVAIIIGEILDDASYYRIVNVLGGFVRRLLSEFVRQAAAVFHMTSRRRLCAV